MPPDLPINAVLSDLLAAMAKGPRAVLIAPPGAGKTTAVAPALLSESWCSNRILLLSPRRIAARAAAERMAELVGEKVGGVIGYQTRMDSRVSAATRIIVMTEGIFVRQIIADPELTGVSAVLFDEVHERSLDSDFAFALALEAQAAFRPDLRILPMSATLDGARFAALLDGAPVIESMGVSHPLTHHHIGRRAEQPIEDAMAAAVKLALREQGEGDILAFLPGVREIARAMERLSGLSNIAVHQLHGTLPQEAQRAALRPDAERRKVILATSIAETSLTIDGVRIVIDSGLSRRPVYDVAADVTRLTTQRVSLASATQRAGRAARQGVGHAYRLWEEGATSGLVPFDTPEILAADMAPLLLDCAAFGEAQPERLRWLDSPPAPALAAARVRLTGLGALSQTGAITAYGQAIAALPLEPGLAHMLLQAARRGQAEEAATLALLLQERGLGGQGSDLSHRLDRFHGERGGRADTARSMARRWAKLAEGQAARDTNLPPLSPAALLALAYPDRVAKRRDAKGENWASAGGRGFRLDPADPLARSDWLAIADVQGAASGARILSAAALTEGEVTALFADQMAERAHITYNPKTDRVEGRRARRLGAITLSEGQNVAIDDVAAAEAMLTAVRAHGLSLIPFGERAQGLLERAAYAGEEALTDAALTAKLDQWLAPILAGKRRFADIGQGALRQALTNALGWDTAQRVDTIAPAHFTSPAGTTHAIDYAAEAGPTVTLRVQALYGLDQHPVVGANRVPLLLALTSPAGRPVQVTRDLPAFWRSSWRDVQRDMKGRYPRHHWPDKPWTATASLATKKRQGI